MTLSSKIIEIIKDNLENPETPVQMDSHLVEDLGIDSFTTLMIVNAIEDEYEINIDVSVIKDVRLVSDVVSQILKNYPEIEEQK